MFSDYVSQLGVQMLILKVNEMIETFIAFMHFKTVCGETSDVLEAAECKTTKCVQRAVR